ncbi:serine/threonine protein kinase [Nonomuraea sp. NPDC048826]|uniref:serine/threonine protein kinase n=1 Tax=Nonomuraea sp. NPDC048826 TaxID=3364347 RepID=UPI00372235F6
MTVTPRRPGDPERLGPYVIAGRLGQGGQGIVYLGEGPGGERVAVKMLTGGLDRSFARELAAARQVAEFCTARVIAADLDHDPPYVASEYIDGPPLADVAPLHGTPLARLAIATATALTAIHQAGVVHRDFKPGNVLMAPDGPRVIDFGIARLTDSSTTGGALAGTPRYMAPEQFAGGPVGPAADVFAWGCTIVFAAAARPPFGGDTIPAVIHRVLHAEPDLGGLTGPLRDIVARCLDKDPARRPSARDVLLELLGGSTPGGEADTLREAAIAVAAPRVSRRTVLIGAGAATAALATTAALLWGRGPGGSPRAFASDGPGGTPSPTEVQPRALAAALQDAIAIAPMADFTHEGGLTQSDTHATAGGKLAYHPETSDSSSSVDYAMSIRPSAGNTRPCSSPPAPARASTSTAANWANRTTPRPGPAAGWSRSWRPSGWPPTSSRSPRPSAGPSASTLPPSSPARPRRACRCSSPTSPAGSRSSSPRPP